MCIGLPTAVVVYDMGKALKIMEQMRNDSSYESIALCSENADQVGKAGVDAVRNGVLPDGQAYVYKTGRGNPLPKVDEVDEDFRGY